MSDRDPFDPRWKVTPTTRTMRLLAVEGWAAGVVEQRIPGTFITRDFLGIADILAVRSGCILAVQATSDTSGSHASTRIEKCSASPHLRTWLDGGGVFAVWTWSVRKARGGKPRVELRRWTARREGEGVTWVESPRRDRLYEEGR